MVHLEELKTAAPGSETPASAKSDKILSAGYLLLAASASFYAILAYGKDKAELENDGFPAFIIHYLIALGYLVVLVGKKAYGINRSWLRENIHYTMVLLNLFLVSAYALNRQLPVFEDSVLWLCIYLVVSSLATLSLRYYTHLPRTVNKIQYFLLGSTLVLYTYLALYIGRVYFPATLGILVLGVGLLAFVPIFLLIGSAALIRYTKAENRVSTNWIVAGATVAVTISILYIIAWDSRIHTLERLANQSVIYTDTELPTWVKVSQSIERDWISDRILKSDFIYTTVDDRDGEFDFLSRGMWLNMRTHDPLVYMATFWRKSPISREDRKKILQGITDNRHRTQERLWRGDNLTTSYVVTDVDLYPQLRLAYTEQYLNIRNNNKPDWWGMSQEAIYTFQLPEGSVVTSLSLWVNGKEEKAILTSKQKATEAYTTIVGKERRDPSVVHWQEGNTVTVRVFPCTPAEERKVKIGITSPLPEENGRIVYRQTTFRGPNAHRANETVRFRFIGALADDVSIPKGFHENEKGEYMVERSYDPDFSISWKALAVEDNHYTSEGTTYSLKPYTPESRSLHLSYLFLDINNSWTAEEVNVAYAVLTKCNVYAYVENEFVRLHEDNWENVTGVLRARNFSLFPFHHVKDAEHSLVVTKGKPLSPFLRDMERSTFAESVSRYFAADKKVNVFNLAGGTSAYIRSLRELRAFNFATGDVTMLADLLEKNQFPVSAEDENHVVLHDARLVLARGPAVDSADTAPDHLARLFAYNNIMRQVGTHFFNDTFINDALVNEAARAYVVSPVSSLIVLETKEDYDRFGIKDIENSLGNATHNQSGAVPEPHEWALIVVFLAFVLFNVIRQYRLRTVTASRV